MGRSQVLFNRTKQRLRSRSGRGGDNSSDESKKKWKKKQTSSQETAKTTSTSAAAENSKATTQDRESVASIKDSSRIESEREPEPEPETISYAEKPKGVQNAEQAPTPTDENSPRQRSLQRKQRLTAMEEESLVDLANTISNPYSAAEASIEMGFTFEGGFEKTPEIDVSGIGITLQLLSLSSRLRIPQHLAATLDDSSAAGQGETKQAVVRKAIAVRQEKKHLPKKSPRKMSFSSNDDSKSKYGKQRDFPSSHSRLSFKDIMKRRNLKSKRSMSSHTRSGTSIHTGRSSDQDSTIASRRGRDDDVASYNDSLHSSKFGDISSGPSSRQTRESGINASPTNQILSRTLTPSLRGMSVYEEASKIVPNNLLEPIGANQMGQPALSPKPSSLNFGLSMSTSDGGGSSLAYDAGQSTFGMSSSVYSAFGENDEMTFPSLKAQDAFTVASKYDASKHDDLVSKKSAYSSTVREASKSRAISQDSIISGTSKGLASIPDDPNSDSTRRRIMARGELNVKQFMESVESPIEIEDEENQSTSKRSVRTPSGASLRSDEEFRLLGERVPSVVASIDRSTPASPPSSSMAEGASSPRDYILESRKFDGREHSMSFRTTGVDAPSSQGPSSRGTLSRHEMTRRLERYADEDFRDNVANDSNVDIVEQNRSAYDFEAKNLVNSVAKQYAMTPVMRAADEIPNQGLDYDDMTNSIVLKPGEDETIFSTESQRKAEVKHRKAANIRSKKFSPMDEILERRQTDIDSPEVLQSTYSSIASSIKDAYGSLAAVPREGKIQSAERSMHSIERRSKDAYGSLASEGKIQSTEKSIQSGKRRGMDAYGSIASFEPKRKIQPGERGLQSVERRGFGPDRQARSPERRKNSYQGKRPSSERSLRSAARNERSEERKVRSLERNMDSPERSSHRPDSNRQSPARSRNSRGQSRRSPGRSMHSPENQRISSERSMHFPEQNMLSAEKHMLQRNGRPSERIVHSPDHILSYERQVHSPGKNIHPADRNMHSPDRNIRASEGKVHSSERRPYSPGKKAEKQVKSSGRKVKSPEGIKQGARTRQPSLAGKKGNQSIEQKRYMAEKNWISPEKKKNTRKKTPVNANVPIMEAATEDTDLDRWLESAMATKSEDHFEPARKSGGEVEELDTWLDSVICK